MSDLDIAALQQRLIDFAETRRWGPYHTPKNLAMALTVEAVRTRGDLPVAHAGGVGRGDVGP
jgi:hypothetical protein